MKGIGIIGTAAALLNYSNAKSEYDKLKEQQDGLTAAVQTYNENKLDNYYENTSVDEKPNNLPNGVRITTLLRVGNIAKVGGKIANVFRAQASVILSNTSNQKYHITSVEAGCYIFDTHIGIFKISYPETNEISQKVDVNKDLEPGETLEITLPKGISGLPKEIMDELRKAICAAAGKKLITSCPKLNIESGCETADIRIWWGNGMQGYTLKKSGVLRYCGEAYL